MGHQQRNAKAYIEERKPARIRLKATKKATRQVHVAGYSHTHFPQASSQQDGRPFDVDSRINLALANRSGQLIVDEGQRSPGPPPPTGSEAEQGLVR